MSKFSVSSVYPSFKPFFKLVAIYFIVAYHVLENRLLVTAAKVAPILALAVLVCLHQTKAGPYSRRICIGLLMSSVGDVFLVYRDHGYLLLGILFFGLSHLCYLSALNLWPLRPLRGVPFLCNALFFYYLINGTLSGALAVGLPLYVMLVSSMGWRACSLDHSEQHVRLGGLFGGVLFVVSDTLLCIEIFDLVAVPLLGPLVMATYYGAQFGLALSTVTSL